MSALKQYFTSTKSLLYSFLFSLPLFLVYETLIIISQPNSEHAVRISIDVWMKTLFTALGVNAVSFSLLLMVFIGIGILIKERARLKELRFKYFPFLLVESILYAVVVALISSTITTALLNFSSSDPINELSYLQKLALSLGAGIYEELFFRVILVTVFIFLFKKLFKNKKWPAVVVAVTLSAFLFSAVHYMGSMGDLFTFSSFFYRFLFGLILNGLFVARGFGVAAWTHALYDVMVITFF